MAGGMRKGSRTGTSNFKSSYWNQCILDPIWSRVNISHGPHGDVSCQTSQDDQNYQEPRSNWTKSSVTGHGKYQSNQQPG